MRGVRRSEAHRSCGHRVLGVKMSDVLGRIMSPRISFLSSGAAQSSSSRTRCRAVLASKISCIAFSEKVPIGALEVGNAERPSRHVEGPRSAPNWSRSRCTSYFRSARSLVTSARASERSARRPADGAGVAMVGLSAWRPRAAFYVLAHAFDVDEPSRDAGRSGDGGEGDRLSGLLEGVESGHRTLALVEAVTGSGGERVLHRAAMRSARIQPVCDVDATTGMRRRARVRRKSRLASSTSARSSAPRSRPAQGDALGHLGEGVDFGGEAGHRVVEAR